MDLSEIIHDDKSNALKSKIIDGARIDVRIYSDDCQMNLKASLYRDYTVRNAQSFSLISL